VTDWPDYQENRIKQSSEQAMALLQQTIGAIRNIRGEMNVPPTKKAHVIIKSANKNNLQLIAQNEGYLMSLAKLGELSLKTETEKPKFSASSIISGLEIFVPLEGLIDIELERNRLNKEISRLDTQIQNISKKLMNQDFIRKAPQLVVEKEKKKLNDFRMIFDKLQSNLKSLED
ncbi:MAG: valine--tRNA ligase, partial [bacterium]|nr:valine--tRNA ligase [bacterium]